MAIKRRRAMIDGGADIMHDILRVDAKAGGRRTPAEDRDAVTIMRRAGLSDHEIADRLDQPLEWVRAHDVQR